MLVLPDMYTDYELVKIMHTDVHYDVMNKKIGEPIHDDVVGIKRKKPIKSKKSVLSSFSPTPKAPKASNLLKTPKKTKGKTTKNGRVVFIWRNVRKSIAPKIQSQMKLRGIASRLHEIYDEGFAFPKWVLEYGIWDSLDFRSTRVYYPKGSLKLSKQTLLQREPCNIDMVKLFDVEDCKKAFGWDTSFYTTYFEKTNRLAPNIGVYVRTPIVCMKASTMKSIHLMNLIGLAFDNDSQPDAQVFGNPDVNTLIDVYTRIWEKALQCAVDLEVRTIVSSVVGGNHFSPIDPEEFRMQVHNVVLAGLQKKYPSVVIQRPKSDIMEYISYTSQEKLNNMLFINAWDPHSILGNGNKNDCSLDGVFGRYTAISVLGWTGTNQYVSFHEMSTK